MFLKNKERILWWSTDTERVATDGNGNYQPEAIFLEVGFYKIDVYLEGVGSGYLNLEPMVMYEELLDPLPDGGFILNSNGSRPISPNRILFDEVGTTPLTYGILEITEMPEFDSTNRSYITSWEFFNEEDINHELTSFSDFDDRNVHYFEFTTTLEKGTYVTIHGH